MKVVIVEEEGAVLGLNLGCTICNKWGLFDADLPKLLWAVGRILVVIWNDWSISS